VEAVGEAGQQHVEGAVVFGDQLEAADDGDVGSRERGEFTAQIGHPLGGQL